MKREQVVSIIEAWVKPEIFNDVYNGNVNEWADNLLYVLETECGMLPPNRIIAVQEDFYGYPKTIMSYDVKGTPDWD